MERNFLIRDEVGLTGLISTPQHRRCNRKHSIASVPKIRQTFFNIKNINKFRLFYVAVTITID